LEESFIDTLPTALSHNSLPLVGSIMLH